MNHTQKICLERGTHLPDADDGIGDKDQEDDDGLHEGGGWFLSFLKQSQHLRDKGHVKASYTANVEANCGQLSCNSHAERVLAHLCFTSSPSTQTLHMFSSARYRRKFDIFTARLCSGVILRFRLHASQWLRRYYTSGVQLLSRLTCPQKAAKPLTGWAGDKVDQERSEQRLAL